jgi:hypothetical protein
MVHQSLQGVRVQQRLQLECSSCAGSSLQMEQWEALMAAAADIDQALADLEPAAASQGPAKPAEDGELLRGALLCPPLPLDQAVCVEV